MWTAIAESAYHHTKQHQLAAKPVSGAAIEAEAKQPGYAAPDLREQVRDTPPSNEGVGALAVKVGGEAAPKCTCGVATYVHEPGCLFKHSYGVKVGTPKCTCAPGAYTHTKGCPAAPRDLPTNSGPLPAGSKVPDQYVQLDLDKSASGTGSRIRDERLHHYKLRVKPAIGTLDLTMTYLGDPTKAPIQVGVVVRLSHADLGEVQGVVESIEQEQPAP